MFEALGLNTTLLYWIATAVHVPLAVAASGHAVLFKRDTAATIGWAGLIWLVPFLGAFLYFCFGINRIERRARSLRGSLSQIRPQPPVSAVVHDWSEQFTDEQVHFASLHQLVGDLTERPLLSGNRLTPLINGEAAYPAMLEAIDNAQESITLCTYIFDDDRVGSDFVSAIVRAIERGVEVRVLIDSIGARYSHPSMVRRMRRENIPVAVFLPTLVPRLLTYANLRNHRKICVVDGRLGFTGGMNIRDGHRLDLDPRHPVIDLHFQIEGPVVAHLQEVFAVDWEFSTGEKLAGKRWFPPIEPVGDSCVRGVSDGPDEDFEKLLLTILGALSVARRRVIVVTPYFLPDSSLIDALSVAAMRGVEVQILLPEYNNIALVKWACTAILPQVLQRGCRVWYSPGPFDHTKLILVDDVWTLLGSTNWDPRSLRLNFEFNLECYDARLAGTLTELAESKLARAREVTLEEIESRGLPARLRDGAARLFSPYL